MGGKSWGEVSRCVLVSCCRVCGFPPPPPLNTNLHHSQEGKGQGLLLLAWEHSDCSGSNSLELLNLKLLWPPCDSLLPVPGRASAFLLHGCHASPVGRDWLLEDRHGS